MDAFQMLKDIIFMRTDICQLKSAMQKKVFYYSKTDSAKKLIVVEKMGNGRMHTELANIHNMRNRSMKF